MRFYHDILGFTEFRRGGGTPKMVSWLNMRVPESQDYLEMMLYNTMPEADKRGTKAYGKEIEVKVGVKHNRQANLFDPDGTRIELMEPDTFEGKPVPPSTAAVPLP